MLACFVYFQMSLLTRIPHRIIIMGRIKPMELLISNSTIIFAIRCKQLRLKTTVERNILEAEFKAENIRRLMDEHRLVTLDDDIH